MKVVVALLLLGQVMSLKMNVQERQVQLGSAAECPGDPAYRGTWAESKIEGGGFFGKYDPCPCSIKLLKPQSEKTLPDLCHPELLVQNQTLAMATGAQEAGGAMAIRMYHYIAAVIEPKAPANLLVFSVGNDSPLWKSANHGGKTLFKEQSAEWRELVLKKEPTLDIDIASYQGRGDEARDAMLAQVVSDPSKGPDLLGMPSIPDTDDWHTIIVDGPSGSIGRMQPIYMASLLACKTLRRSTKVPVDVFVHDLDRKTEVTWSDGLLGVQKDHGFRMILWPQSQGHFPGDGGSAPLRHYRYDSPDQIPLCSKY